MLLILILTDKSYYKEFLSFGEGSSLDMLRITGFENDLDMSSISDKPNFRASSSIESLLEDNNAGNTGILNQIESLGYK